MASKSSSSDRGRSSAPRSNPAVIPGLIAVVLIVVAIAVAVMTKKDKKADAPEPVATSPFQDMPPEVPPPAKEHKGGSNLPPAPDSITTEPQWIEAKALAADARELYEAAANAKAKGDIKLATEKGLAAREKYEAAVTMTADWEETILSQYNEYDSKIVAIHDARSDWFKKLLWLKKSVGH
ncbi:MAG TPA: hypothetical protein VK843_12325 [Planctomycetota bacterium]|nr:hypothetical protein [Planctomycetota bacterium]